MNRLENKVAIVTGAGRRPEDGIGTGRASAVLFAREGAKVLLVDMNEEAAERTLSEIESEGGEASVFVADVSVEAECRALVETAIDRYGQIDVLMNNVGIGGNGKVTEIDFDLWDKVQAVDVKSMAMICKYAIPEMAKSGGGSVINVSSVDGVRAGNFHNIPYAVAKGGVITLTTATAVHHGREGVRVNCIVPGHLDTPMVSRLSKDALEMRRKAGPLGTVGTGWDIGWAAVFLASDEARWITGICLPVDAGVLAASPLGMFNEIAGTEGERRF